MFQSDRSSGQPFLNGNSGDMVGRYQRRFEKRKQLHDLNLKTLTCSIDGQKNDCADI